LTIETADNAGSAYSASDTESAGGHLTASLELAGGGVDFEGGLDVNGLPSSVSHIVNFYGLSSLTKMPPTVPRSTSLQPEVMLDTTSPLCFITPGAAPFLLIHGDSDALVPLSQSELFAVAMAQPDVQQELIPVEGADHCFFYAEDQIDDVDFSRCELSQSREPRQP
jgi:acetyl esterase/lipase